MAAMAMRGSPDIANGSSNPHIANGAPKTPGRRNRKKAPSTENEHEAEYDDPKTPHSGRDARPPGQLDRSFSARARNQPEGNLNYTTRKPVPPLTSELSEESTTPRGLPTAPYSPEPSAAMPEIHVQSPLSSPPTRSNTTRSVSASDSRREWASERSPLQKLEVTLTGISKEEKRARVQQAEIKARERIARKKAEQEKAELMAAMAREASAQRAQPENQPPPGAARRNEQRDIPVGDGMRNGHAGAPRQRQPESMPVRHNRAVSTNPRYPSIGHPEDPQYTRADVAVPSSARIGNVPRRSVTVSGPAAKPAFASNISHSRSMSQAAPRPMQAPVALRAETTGELLTAPRAPQDSAESQTKPKKQSVSFNVPPPTPPPIFEWRNAQPARLAVPDFDFQNFDMERSKAWWEGGGTNDRRKSRALPKNYKSPAQKLTGATEHKNFQPSLFLRCGPLLRYTGIKRVKVDGASGPIDTAIWRGSIMIVTKDSRSSYETPPTLRLFSQPMDLLPPPPVEISHEDGVQLAPEYVDPTAGLMKVGRDGRPLYVKPVEHVEEQVDLSFVENDDGIYELSPSMIDYTSEGMKQPMPSNRMHAVDGETASLYRDIPGARLYADAARDVTFWRFNLEVELSTTQQRIAYRINQGPALGFWVPPVGESMNIMFHSGNGFSPSADSDKVCGPDPLWRDILNEHQTRPFHVMIGGGDQIFNDSVITKSAFFQEWIKIKHAADRYGASFTPEFRAELEQFYLERYAAWFSQGLFSLANSQIPTINIWNDHEIFEGFGSYHNDFMQSSVISGIGKIAFKYYLLFQHHSVPDETEIDEPSWLLGAHPGPYIGQKSRNLFMSLGQGVSFLGLDCRTERRSNEVLSEETCDLLWDRCHREIMKGETKHLIVLSSVPVAYPRVAMLRNFMSSRKSLGKAGVLGGLANRSGGNVEVFDDHWAGKHLKSERTWLVEDLQDLAAEKSVRITILSGDVHLAAIGQFYSNPKLDIPKDQDYRYMPNVISSAIADIPETDLIADMLNKRNTVHHMDSNTDEDIVPIFTQDVNGKARNNKRLLPRRNWCSIREYKPGSTPPDTPESEMIETPEPRPRKLQRTLSLGRGDKGSTGKPGILRRLSTRGPPPTRTMSFNRGDEAAFTRRASIDGPAQPHESGDSYFPGAGPGAGAPTRPSNFHRRPTNLSQKAAKKAAKQGDDGAGTYINLEGGLAITLNLEISPQDPSGVSAPYKLLVPALHYNGTEYDPPPAQIVKGWRKFLPRRKKNEGEANARPEAEEDYSDDDEQDDYEDHDLINNTRANAATSQQHQYQPQYEYEGYPGSEEDVEDSESEVPQRLPPNMIASHTPSPEEHGRPRKKKWFGVI
ncbi:uncharacterized protein N7479_001889 [Penicillium vulpinum]|uniref:PhoD-like phosphatase domain-containing protein n=1 Tax=Penicillium vulpinum TaxID=29845 RepID=A0A1V6S418_9EURO|nr:uncharacterized protein N7479_001889 [Penicillium vulpinum]KAJ5971971.1 hypothetical protein N7479_001889 [Penicillium vulpinum]OQE08797.1 hypothetical protein PENVUL_c008G10262 [Penicillium vulpinum]